MQGVTASNYGVFGSPWVVLAVIAVVAIVALMLYNGIKRPASTAFSGTEPPEDDAHKTLRFRYEHGEIDLDTYQQLRTELDRRR